MVISMKILEKINPIVIFIYFASVIILAMVITNPFYLAVSVICSLVASVLMNPRRNKWIFFAYILTAIFIIAINPLLNTMGETVLFTYFGGRPYTLEALLYGGIMAMLFLTVINWFSCYSAVITSDKFMYIFGGIIPSASLLLSMVLRFVPVYKDKIKALSQSRKAIGKGLDDPKYRGKINNGLTLISALTSVSLENSIVTANSMESRGYGTGRRTSFSVFRFTTRDLVLLLTEVGVFIIALITCVFTKNPVEFIPRIILPTLSGEFFVGLISYGVLLCLPAIIILTEEIRWNVLKSRI